MKNHEFIVRASAVGDLMTKGRTKDAEWGDTSLGLIRKAVLSNKYGIEEYITSKHMEKGILNESEGLSMYRTVVGGSFPIDDVKQLHRCGHALVIVGLGADGGVLGMVEGKGCRQRGPQVSG